MKKETLNSLKQINLDFDTLYIVIMKQKHTIYRCKMGIKPLFQGGRKMGVSNDSYYHPEEALQELMIQERILNTAIDIQALLGLLVEKDIITRDEINQFRQRVKLSAKYKSALEQIEVQKTGFEKARDNPQEYLKALLNAKMSGKIK